MKSIPLGTGAGHQASCDYQPVSILGIGGFLAIRTVAAATRRPATVLENEPLADEPSRPEGASDSET